MDGDGTDIPELNGQEETMTQRRESEQGRGESTENLAQKGGERAAQTPGSASNLAQYFRGMDFPATKQDLLRHVQQNNAPGEVRQIVQALPENQRYTSMADLMAAWGQERR